MPLIGLLNTFPYIEHGWMVNEPDCISACIQQTSPLCYGITYESYRQECRLITQFFPNSTIPNQSFLNWRTYIRTIDS
ncbi:unnamed protein product [Adineta steineri]|uniref:Apple domain-containing protein n=1 Tax=Adineta steineri TaxID=433720 RepID=A0A814DEK0_9BILA|nr:unnamed protein product [Adineta steineri]CAF1106119.1 unnamed protein product [Adineta steineri]CAF1507157.1 unnamed protein product [Adineta steineri]CAF3882161.1 unnamed protein product [Adineta steineri]